MKTERPETRFRPHNGTEPETKIMVGHSAVPTAGQDQGRLFLIVGTTDDGRLLLADGKRHRLDRPKKKKRMHLGPLSENILAQPEALAAGSVTDGDIRRALAAYRREAESSVKA